MADLKAFNLEVMDRLWIKKSLELQRAALQRSQTKEIPGSQICDLRGKEIEQLSVLISKFI